MSDQLSSAMLAKLKELNAPPGAPQPVDAVDKADERLNTEKSDTARAMRVGLWALGIGFGGFLLWAGLAPLDEGVPSPAMVTIDTKRKPVQHQTGGIIKEVLVGEGTVVKAGQTLIRLDDAVAEATHQASRQRYLALRAMEGRLLAEQAMIDINHLLRPGHLAQLAKILDDPEAMKAVESIEGWRSLGDNVIETIINKSEKVKELKNKAKEGKLTPQEKRELSAEEKEYKSKRKLVQEKLIKFATRIPAFMYLTDFRENTLQDVITKLESELFRTVTGLTVKDFHLLVQLKVFNTEHMNQAVFAFRRYEDASLRYTGIESHSGLTHYGLYDTVVAKDG